MTILAIDFGGTQVKSALVSEEFAIEKSLPTQSSPQTLEQAIDVIDQIVTSVEEDLSGIAISVPGTVDTEEGVIYHGGLLRFFHGFRIKEVLEAKYHLPVMALNDGKAAALAELATGHLQGVTNGAALVLGSGLGGGFIINGKLFQGSHFQAGELTFLLPVQMEKVDPSLMRGMTLSAVGLITKVNEVLGNSDLKDGLAAFKAINAGDKTVYSLFENYCRNLAITILKPLLIWKPLFLEVAFQLSRFLSRRSIASLIRFTMRLTLSVKLLNVPRLLLVIIIMELI